MQWNHYLLTQVEDIIMQIYLAWNPLPIMDEDVLYRQR